MSDASDYERLLVENYCIVASTALLWFDFALTFTTEVRRIWRRRFTGATVVYLFTRYAALIERVFFVLEVLLWNSTDETCGRIDRVDDVLTIINYFAFASFTILRVYGVWGRDWKPLVIVVPLTLVRPALYIVESSNYVPIQFGPPWGCANVYGYSNEMLAKFSTVAKSANIAADAILIALTWWKTFGINKASTRLGVRTPLATLLLRDGTAYFLILLAIQIITIVSSQIGSSLTVWLVWPYFDQIFTVIFLSRFMLDLRGLYFSEHVNAEGNATDTTTRSGHVLSDIRFTTSNVVGNLGATLSTTLTYSDFSATSSVVSSHPESGGGEKQKQGQGQGQVCPDWYEDEVPKYADHPFEEGMVIPIWVDVPKVEETELEEVQSPVSPESPQNTSAV
ncbi:hypothetical protein L226DRAFT_540198 [Lentinus tigrinus ALCF2SS1-7]|uniref:DUF6533 domain-containing protein n=1 Tax=Lentinus tigrinus ALCF2SS1-6 TaxID=1328759 RepID=A0A5C2S4L6_9APHY|nr:hypothetical protein L227DRAFT_577529 [Lentinus tigrinus ALCF2SS1-6]RPD69033.1 hypothetical protein L226DRAFT_540198 [Lentinus tigrinus ALCF2SS1-7]